MRREAPKKALGESREARFLLPPVASCLPPFSFLLAVASCLSVLFLSACESELIQKQEEQIRLQQEELERQRQEIEKLRLARQKEEQKRRECNRAFRDFEKAQAASNAEEAIVLYRRGLKICPDDDVAHYELGIIFRDIGRIREARDEFEAALKINPKFLDARRQLEAIERK